MCNFNGLELKERENLEDEHAGKNLFIQAFPHGLCFFPTRLADGLF